MTAIKQPRVAFYEQQRDNPTSPTNYLQAHRINKITHYISYSYSYSYSRINETA